MRVHRSAAAVDSCVLDRIDVAPRAAAEVVADAIRREVETPSGLEAVPVVERVDVEGLGAEGEGEGEDEEGW